MLAAAGASRLLGPVIAAGAASPATDVAANLHPRMVEVATAAAAVAAVAAGVDDVVTIAVMLTLARRLSHSQAVSDHMHLVAGLGLCEGILCGGPAELR